MDLRPGLGAGPTGWAGHRTTRRSWPERPREGGARAVMPGPMACAVLVMRQSKIGNRQVLVRTVAARWASRAEDARGWARSGARRITSANPNAVRNPGLARVVGVAFESWGAPKQDWMMWAEDRPGAILALGPWLKEVLASDQWERSGLEGASPASRTAAPGMPWLWHQSIGAGERPNSAWGIEVGGYRMTLPSRGPGGRGRSGKGEKPPQPPWWLMLGDDNAQWTARDAGFQWIEPLGLWGTSEDATAAALGAYMDEAGAERIVRQGVPMTLHPELTRAPVLIPWQGERWMMVGSRHRVHGFESPPHRHFRARGAAPGWTSRSGNAAYTLRAFAPRSLSQALEEAHQAGELHEIRAGQLNIEQDLTESHGRLQLVGEPPPPPIVVCRGCNAVVVRGELAAKGVAQGTIACGEGNGCDAGRSHAPVYPYVAIERLIAHKETATHDAWRRIAYAQAKIEVAASDDVEGIQIEDRDIATLAPRDRSFFKHQVTSIRWALSHAVALDATIMSGGKTIITLAVTNALWRRSRAGNRPLVLCVVKASLKDNWMVEASRWLDPDIPHTILAKRTSAVPACGVVVASYETVREHEALKSVPLAMVASDEAHWLKNPEKKRTRAVLALNSPRWLFLSGSPIYNRPPDAYVYLSKAAPKAYGNRSRFRRAFALEDPTTVGAEKAQMLEDLAQALRGTLMHRPPKREVLAALPPKRPPMVVAVDLGADAEQIAAEERALLRALAHEKGGKAALFAQLQALRAHVAERKIPAVSEAMETLHEEGAPFLVFAWHRKIAQALSDAAHRTGIRCGMLHGGVSQSHRTRQVKAFQDGELDALVLTMQVGGEGLNLQRAEAVLFAELDWTPAAHHQAEGRAYRHGQTAELRTYYFVGRHTVDEHIAALSAAKDSAGAVALDDETPVAMLGRIWGAHEVQPESAGATQ